MSQGNLLIEPFNKVFNKARSLRMSIRLPGRRMSQIDQGVSTSDIDRTHLKIDPCESPSSICVNEANKSVSTNNMGFLGGFMAPELSIPQSSRTPLKLAKAQNILKKITENSDSIESDDNDCKNEKDKDDNISKNRKYSSESFKMVHDRPSAKKGSVDGETSDSVSSLNKTSKIIPTVNFTRSFKKQSGCHMGLASDCDSEFTVKMELEDKSLEDFNRIINQNKNLVLNWDYVQSSDYL